MHVYLKNATNIPGKTSCENLPRISQLIKYDRNGQIKGQLIKIIGFKYFSNDNSLYYPTICLNLKNSQENYGKLRIYYDFKITITEWNICQMIDINSLYTLLVLHFGCHL